ncbi:exonuclease RecJ [Candidatus Koribacter versatilis Ellin345]|uniref:Single-stranded-DNA-specific exonuclease RecJ n=1 Tax=Koribacter versatilis (strain Ellin345) TaxID=204669 RepID=Q1IIX8_KORVE|nr:single-stranded-DNA-specific exonuclease RecJ [Candidatus Koribacter versatilis]ABF43172.1 exonuclease RecJ [Candidatus Koribacter versatilis Ellin345]
MRWTQRPFDFSVASRLSAEANISPLVAVLLAARGIKYSDEAWMFLNPSLDALHSPYEMLGMDAAVERLMAAIAKKEQVLIYGDYDVDGTTATVILKTAIEICGGRAEFHVPHRLLEGYGMRDEVIEKAAADGIRLIISVDTGIRAFAAAETASRLGLDLIVTDHHLPGADGVPKALAVLNPNQTGCDYPCKHLCGAGVAFKVAQALLEKSDRARLIPSFLKMAAIATIADAVPLTGENRVFVSLGLEGLRKPVNAGLKELLALCRIDGRTLSTQDVAFRIAPRLNAAGRMDVARDVVELFTTRDAKHAKDVAQHLNKLNGDRQEEEARIMAAIEKQLADDASFKDRYSFVLDGAEWHRGVIGICASRVVDRVHRPALVIARHEGEAHGSGRSIPSFHLLNALESCADLFSRYGGHAHAVGFALPEDRLPQLREKLEAYARQHLKPADFVPEMVYDTELPLSDVSEKLYLMLQKLEPFGMSNPQPVFVSRGARLAGPARTLKEKHVKMRLAPQSNGGFQRSFEALAWRKNEKLQAEPPLNMGDLLDVAFTIDHNDHPDFGGLQLILCDWAKPAASASSAR